MCSVLKTLAQGLAGDRVEWANQTTCIRWVLLQRYRQWRCYICPDHTGEFADVAVGDPWYRPVEPGEAGKSLIVARTRRGLDAVKAAAEDGYLVLERQDSTLLARSQPNLLRTRGRLRGQLLVMRVMGAPRPRYVGFPTLRWWLQPPLRAKVQSTAGTARRVARWGLCTWVDVPPRGDRAPERSQASA